MPESWTWSYLDTAGAPLTDMPANAFPSQGDAESWLGESWRDLVERGVDAVTLLQDGAVVYGPMSLRSAQ